MTRSRQYRSNLFQGGVNMAKYQPQNFVEIHLSDLTPEKQKEVLETSGCGEDDDWGLSPVPILEFN